VIAFDKLTEKKRFWFIAEVIKLRENSDQKATEIGDITKIVYTSSCYGLAEIPAAH